MTTEVCCQWVSSEIRNWLKNARMERSPKEKLPDDAAIGFFRDIHGLKRAVTERAANEGNVPRSSIQPPIPSR